MNKKILKLPVLRVRQPIGDFFIASISAKDLVEISYSDVRRLVNDQRDLEKYLGIQRPVNPSRIKKMKKYIEGPDATFPTSVVVSIEEQCATLEETGKVQGILTLKPFKPKDELDGDEIPYGRIAKVIDGQHRIAAFMKDKTNKTFDFADVNFDINLAIFIGADVSEQANIFATVNLEQTKVNRSLVYDLTDLAKSRSVIAQDWRTPEEYFRIFLGGIYEQGVQSVRETASAIVYGRIQAGCGQSCCR